MPLRYYTEEDYKAIEAADICSELVPIAINILQRMCNAGCDDIKQVCGPISTGGKGSVLENIAEIDKVICEFVEQGHQIFNQMPFEGAMERVHKEWEAAGNTTYCQPILDEFYLPIFESGMVKNMVFLNDWQSSKGARWEHDQAMRLGINITYL